MASLLFLSFSHPLIVGHTSDCQSNHAAHGSLKRKGRERGQGAEAISSSEYTVICSSFTRSFFGSSFFFCMPATGNKLAPGFSLKVSTQQICVRYRRRQLGRSSPHDQSSVVFFLTFASSFLPSSPFTTSLELYRNSRLGAFDFGTKILSRLVNSLI